MSEEIQTVQKVETAVAQPEVTVNATEVDYEKILADKDKEIAFIQEKKEQYRRGLLKAKGKLPEDDELDSSNPEALDALIDRKVQEKFLSTQEARLQAEKEDTLKSVLKRNKELEVALKNRGQITSTSAQGSNQEKAEGKTDSYFSNDQIQALRAKGWSDTKIEAAKKNMLKGTSPK